MLVSGSSGIGLDGLERLISLLSDTDKVRAHLSQVREAETALRDDQAKRRAELAAAAAANIERSKALDSREEAVRRSEADLAAAKSNHATEVSEFTERRAAFEIEADGLRAEVAKRHDELAHMMADHQSKATTERAELTKWRRELEATEKRLEDKDRDILAREQEAAAIKATYEDRLARMREAIA